MTIIEITPISLTMIRSIGINAEKVEALWLLNMNDDLNHHNHIDHQK